MITPETAAWLRTLLGPAVAAALGAGSAYMAIREDLILVVHKVERHDEILRDHEARIRERERERPRLGQ